jgi:hypothetical protein
MITGTCEAARDVLFWNWTILNGDSRRGAAKMPTEARLDLPTAREARIAMLEDALRTVIAQCATCKGRGTISSWNVSSGSPLVKCPDCAAARAALKGAP